ncbi:MAG: hypothetical protein ACRDP6_39405 [Actinoallomurus sp.]
MTLLVAITVALAALAVLAAIVIVAVGGGGELSAEHPDHPPLALPGRRAVGGTDAALLRLPLGLWGYHKQITDEALERFAYELTERDTRIAVLEQELAEARQHGGGAPRDRRRALPAARSDLPVMGDPLATRTDRPSGVPVTGGDPLATRTDREPEPTVAREEPMGLPTTRTTGRTPAPGTADEEKADGDDDPASGHAYAPHTDPWRTVADRRDDDVEEPRDDVGDAEDQGSTRKDDGR